MLTIALSWLVLGRMNLNYRSCHIGSIGYLGIDELPPKMVMTWGWCRWQLFFVNPR